MIYRSAIMFYTCKYDLYVAVDMIYRSVDIALWAMVCGSVNMFNSYIGKVNRSVNAVHTSVDTVYTTV